MTDSNIKSIPNSEFYVTGGTMSTNAPSYVSRQADDDLFEGLKAGNFCYVLTSRQMGKSSLMVRTVGRLKEVGFAVVVLDLTTIGQNVTVEQWYDGIQLQIGQQLHLEDELDDFWLTNERLGPLQRWMKAMREVVLEKVKGPIVLFIDEVDVVHSLNFSTSEFLAGIRAFYNQRDEDAELKRLNFCIIGVTTTSDLIKDVQTTPLNVNGQRIELTDFKESDAKSFAENLGRDPQTNEKLLKRIFYWTGGHPYLTQRFCKEVAENAEVKSEIDIDALCEKLFLSAGARNSEDNLIFVRDRMLRGTDDKMGLLTLYSQIYKGKRVTNDNLNPFTKTLLLSGITRPKPDGNLAISNRIYQNVFDQRWVETNLPYAELRKQRAIYRKRLVGITAAAMAMFVLAIFSGVQWVKADNALKELGVTKESLEQREYALNIAQGKLNTALKDNEEKQAQIRDKDKNLGDKERLIKEQIDIAQVKTEEANKQEQEAKFQKQTALLNLSQANAAKQDAYEKTVLAKQKTIEANRLLYGARIRSAQGAFERGKFDLAKSLISSIDLSANKKGFEWDFLNRLINNQSEIYEIATSEEPSNNPNENGSPLTLFSITTSNDGKIAQVIQSRQNDPFERIEDGYIRIIDSQTNVEIKKFEMEIDDIRLDDGSVYNTVFSPDGKLFAAEFSSNTLDILSTKGWESTLPKLINCSYPSNLTFSADSKLLYAMCYFSSEKDFPGGDEVRAWNTQTGQEQELPDHFKNVKSIASGFFRGKEALFVATKRDLLVWDIENKSFLASRENIIREEGDIFPEIVQIVISQDSKVLAIIQKSGNAIFYYPDKDESSWKFFTYLNPLNSANHKPKFSPDGNLFVTNERDSLRIWNSQNGKFLFTIPLDRSFRNEIAFLKDGKLLVGNGNSFRAWDLSNGFDYTFLSGSKSIISSVAFSPINSKLIGLSESGFVTEWDASTMNKVDIWRERVFEEEAIKGVETVFSTASFSPDGSVIAISANADKILDGDFSVFKVFDTNEKKSIPPLQQDRSGFVTFLPDIRKKVFAFATRDGNVELWDVPTKLNLWSKSVEDFEITSLAFSPDGSLLVVAGNKIIEGFENSPKTAQIVILDSESGKIIPNMDFNIKSEIRSIAFYPDKSNFLLATARADGVIELWRIQSSGNSKPSLINTFYGYDNAVNSIAFFPDGRMVAGGKDGTVRIWNIEEAIDPLLTLKNTFDFKILSIGVSKDGNKIAAIFDNMVKVWSGK